MNWSGVGDFVHMGGYGLYVWGSFGMCALVLVIESVSLALRRKALRDQPFDDADELNTEVLHEA